MFPLIIALLPYIAALLILYLLLTEPPLELGPSSWRSSFLFLVGRVPMRACVRRQGSLSAGWVVKEGRVEPSEEAKRRMSVIWRGWKLDADTFARYCTVCGISFDRQSRPTAEPLLFPETLFLKHMMAIVTASSFPLSPLGLIHVRQSVEARCELSELLGTRCDLRCELSEVRATSKGFEVDMRCTAAVSDGDQRILWSGITTLLSRSGHMTEKRPIERPATASQPFSGDEDSYTGKELAVDKDVGLKYATATGDFNPHHLFPWMARLLGYKQPIVHGLWTLAKVLAAIQEGTNPPLKPPFKMSSTFKKPIYIPSTAVILFTRPSKDNKIRFEVWSNETDLNLLGDIIC